MRAALLFLLYLLQSTAAHATISVTELRTLAYAGDIAGVEAEMAQAHQDSLSGEISYDDLRNLVVVLYRTHPDMDQFRADWIAARPGSPYAQTVMAWAQYYDGFQIRGSKSGRDTPQKARTAFRDRMDSALELARAAFVSAPDFVPATDAIVNIHSARRGLWDWQIKRVISKTMTVTPNFGSLLRVSRLSDRRWGGEGPNYNVDLCRRYHDKIPEYPNLTRDACIVSLMAENGQLDSNWNYVADVLDREDHPVLTTARVYRALERRTNADRQLVMEYLHEAQFDTPWFHRQLWIAHAFSSARYFSPTEESLAFSAALQARLYEQVDAQLVHDPYDLSLLNVAIRDHHKIASRPIRQDNAYRNYLLRIAAVQPLHVENWTLAGTMQKGTSDPTKFLSQDTAMINAIAYSDHNLFMISNYLQPKINQLRTFQQRGDSVAINGQPWPPESEVKEIIGCRIARLIRLFEHAALNAPEHRNRIDGFREQRKLNDLTEEIKGYGVCGDVWEVPIETLRFDPIEIDRTALLTILPNTFP